MKKTLGRVAAEAYQTYIPWERMSHRHQHEWEAVADAVLAAAEARRWQAIEKAPKDRYIMAYSPERKMSFQVIWCDDLNDWQLLGSDWVATMEFTHWTPVPAPPQEVECEA